MAACFSVFYLYKILYCRKFLLAHCCSSFSDALQLEDAVPVVILASKAPNTLSKYRLAWQQWQRWTARFPTVSRFPAKPFKVALYLRELFHTATTIAPIYAAVYGIHWAHQAGVSSPTDHEFAKATVEGCRRLLAKPIRQITFHDSHVYRSAKKKKRPVSPRSCDKFKPHREPYIPRCNDVQVYIQR